MCRAPCTVARDDVERHLPGWYLLRAMADTAVGWTLTPCEEWEGYGTRYRFTPPSEAPVLVERQQVSPWLMPDVEYEVELGDTARAAWWEPYWQAWQHRLARESHLREPYQP